MFLDRAIITVKAGDGGPGAVSFRREKYEPKGGPDGGNGGDGGSVVLQAEDGMSTLYDFRGNPLWAAKNGEPGGGKQCSGATASDLIIRLPPGTMVYNNETGELMHDLKPGERVVIARGGTGGWGNEHYKSSTNQTPRNFDAGGTGEQFDLRLELKLIADAGFVGLPNAGKSTLLAALTRATPKIANYPFTTLSPQLGIAELDNARRIVLADIPGLIEGASRGVGLGHEFLRHIERTRVIVHLLDAQPLDESDPAGNYRVVRKELGQYSAELLEKPEIVALNKMDLVPDEEERRAIIKKLCAALRKREGREVIAISGATGQGLKDLMEKVWGMLRPERTEEKGWKDEAVKG